jgi:hypothetical protein
VLLPLIVAARLVPRPCIAVAEVASPPLRLVPITLAVAPLPVPPLRHRPRLPVFELEFLLSHAAAFMPSPLSSGILL